MLKTLKIFEIKKLKKILFNFNFAKKSAVALILFTMMFGMMAPACVSAGAFDHMQYTPIVGGIFGLINIARDKLDGAGIDLFDSMVSWTGVALVTLTSMPLSLSQSALGWVTSDNFVNVSFTGGTEGKANYNAVVDKGWKIIRNLVNMFIVLAFVIVAIATILGIQEYNAQKLLPLLIAIALLINFTPVICGLMIDASNIAMNHFLSGATLDRSFVETAQYQSGVMLEKQNLETIEKAGLAFVFAGFNLIGTIVFGLFAVLFAVRYIALWILVILSPLAFFCYIFPKARGVWSAWWKQFFQWCIIGIPAAFFIYLSNILIAQMSAGNIVSDPTGEISTTGFGALFMYMIPLAFMVAGLFASFQTGAMGANMITSFAQTTGKKHMTGAKKWAGDRVKESPWVRDRKENWKGRIGKVPEKIPGRIGKEYGIKHKEQAAKDIEERAKQLVHTDPETSEYLARTDKDKAAKVLAHARQGKISEKDEKQLLLLKNMGSHEQLKEVLDKNPNLAAIADPDKVKEEKENIIAAAPKNPQGKPMISDTDAQKQAENAIVREQIQKTTPLKLRQNTEADAFKEKNVVLSMNAEHVKEVTTRGSSKQKANIYKTYAEEVEKLTHGNMSYKTLEELKAKVEAGGTFMLIQDEIDKLSKSKNPEDVIKAKALGSIGDAIIKKRF